MAKNYRVNEKSKKVTAVFSKLTEKEKEELSVYAAIGYKIENRKPSVTIAEMKKQLKNEAPDIYKEFIKEYESEPDGENFENTGFARACKIYNKWKQDKTTLKKAAEAAAKE